MKIEMALSAARSDPAQLPQPCLQPARRLGLRRLAFWGPVLCATILGTGLGAVATGGAPSPLRVPLLVLLALNLLYMAVAGMPSLLGVVLHMVGWKAVRRAQPSGVSATAVVMPVFNEDPAIVFGAMDTMARAVADAGLQRVDFYVLSDTQDPAACLAEQAAFDALSARAGSRVQYRRRADNAGRKVGNLAEFCDRRGDAYDYMVVLDADSLMGASTIGQLIGLMDANPGTGIIQTVPYPVGRNTLFARLQQFSARLYSPLLTEGVNFWQDGEANYWGHNAIVRIAPFRAHCTLPVLPGAEPFGGEILCHDVVEAGLMRGAGWDVWLLPEPMESFEAVPANVVDFMWRERRWCQGNLQHVGVVPLPGFRAMGRFHLGYGIAAYLSAPVCVLFLALASVDAALGGGFAALLFHGAAGAGLVALGAVLLYGGKFGSLAAVLADGAEARRYGGRLVLLASAAAEQLAAFVLSALLIVVHTQYVLQVVRGRAVGWNVQSRDDRGVGWGEAWRRMRGPTLVGLGWLALLPFMPDAVRGWTVPLLAGLLATVPMAVFSSRISVAARRFGLFLIPEERAPAPILRAMVPAQPLSADRAEPAVSLLRLVPSAGDAP